MAAPYKQDGMNVVQYYLMGDIRNMGIPYGDSNKCSVVILRRLYLYDYENKTNQDVY